MSGALAHVVVLDLSRILAGPWSTQVLGDLGAEVIKIERPGQGDDTRGWGPPFLPGDEASGSDARAGVTNGDAAYFTCANRNKKSVTVDFTTAAGQAIVRALAAKADVIVENFKLGGLAAYGLDYESLRELNPRLVYCSITGFGQTGPYAARPGYDFLIQAMGGLMSVTGRKEGEAGAGPQKAGVALTDILTGLYATIGILAALADRDRTGQGQHLDIALLDVQVACLANQAANYLVSGTAPGRMGNAHPNIVPYQDFPTSDGYLIIAVGNDGQFAKLCAELGLPELASDPRYARNQDRVAHRESLIASLSAATRAQTTGHWVGKLEASGVPCGPINAIDAVFADAQVRARELAISMPHGFAGTVPLVASPLRLSKTPVSYRHAPPQLGADTQAVLRDMLGMSTAEIETIAAQGII
jgi:crotonobetainyl-CoA:carnitine CoA-transferase CaiB-like acyl-CoA transferase